MPTRPESATTPRTSRSLAWVGMLAGVAALLAATGCTTSCGTGTCDKFSPPLGLPPMVEKDPSVVLAPDVLTDMEPANVLTPARPERFISLPEAMALALENGTVGVQSLQNPGLVSEDLLGLGGGQGVFGSDAVRVLALNPALTGANLEGTLARFDPVWNTSMQWRKNDQPVQGFASFNNGQFATFSSSIAKPLSTGGVAGVTFTTDYQLLSNPPTGAFGVLNPSYQPRLTLGFEQPLLRGFGGEINQLTGGTPGSALFPSLNNRAGGFAQEGILITRLRFDQQRAEFERAIHFLVLNVESAYWRLYGSYATLYAAEEGLRQAHAAWLISKQRFDAGSLDSGRLALSRAVFEQFRAERMTSLGRVIDNERTLRVLLGLAVEDGSRLVPLTDPSTTFYHPHWQTALQDSLRLRPELVIARKDVDARHKLLKVQENSLLPDLRFTADYSSLGLGTRLDGSGTETGPGGAPTFGNALRVLSGNHFNNWTLGLALNVPIGFRAENANVRQARMQLAQAYYTLKDQERRAQTTLARQYSRVLETYKLIEIRTQARIEFETQLRVRFEQYKAGVKEATLEFLLEAQRQFASATSLEAQARVDYNIALASFEFARGTILNYNKVVIAEGPLPFCADVRAAEHEQEKTRAHVLRERAVAPLLPYLEEVGTAPCPPSTGVPSMPALVYQSKGVPLELEGSARTSPLGLKVDPLPPAPAKIGLAPVSRTEATEGPALKEPVEPARLTAPVTSGSTPMTISNTPLTPALPTSTPDAALGSPSLGSPMEIERK